LKKNKDFKYLCINSNPWFSALTDYSLHFSCYFNKKAPLLYCAEVGSTPMDEKCVEYQIPFHHVPIHNYSILNFLKSFFFLIHFLFVSRKNLKFVFVFQGREHTLCVFTKIIFPFLWKNKNLVRIRGQAQFLKSNIFTKLIYNKLTDKLIFVANCVKENVLFEIPKEKCKIHYYCKDFFCSKTNSDQVFIHASFPPLEKKKIIFLVVARFDPVKGHESLMEAFLKAKFENKQGFVLDAQLLFVGYKANINLNDMYKKYLKIFGSGQVAPKRFFLETKDHKKQLFIIEEKITDLPKMINIARFGVIPSLGSEVICRVAVEFLQSGLPTMSSNVGALPEIFNSFQEFLFYAGNIEDLKEKMENLQKKYESHSAYECLKQKMQDYGRQQYAFENYQELSNFIRDTY
jgi:glycosyltransferase involved in cell wall biosynthesis